MEEKKKGRPRKNLQDEPEALSHFGCTDEAVDKVLVQNLTCAQIEALGKVCRTDEMLDAMIEALEEAGANQRWLTEAKASFQCGMMETTRAILKPKGI